VLCVLYLLQARVAKGALRMRNTITFCRAAALLALFTLSVSVACRKAERVPDQTDRADWVPVDCSDCNGTGKVVYDKDHWFVVNGIEEPGEYSCGICRGTGKVYKFRDDK